MTFKDLGAMLGSGFSASCVGGPVAITAPCGCSFTISELELAQNDDKGIRDLVSHRLISTRDKHHQGNVIAKKGSTHAP